jgi:hypothetical protein
MGVEILSNISYKSTGVIIMNELFKAITLITVCAAAIAAAAIVSFGTPGPSMDQELIDLAVWQDEVVLIAEHDRDYMHRNGAFGK